VTFSQTAYEVTISQANSRHEKEHAKTLFKLLQGIRDTPANLEAAIQGENYEWTSMYKEFARTAREEGFPAIAAVFENIARAEEYHERRFQALLQNIRNGQVFTRDKSITWKCRNCGYNTKETKRRSSARPAPTPGVSSRNSARITDKAPAA